MMNGNTPSALSAAELLFRVNAFMAQSRSETPAEASFNELALLLFAFQFGHVPIYRRLCEARKIAPSAVRHWSEIPALPTAVFKEHIVSSLPEDSRTTVFHSSGTTAHVPSRHFHNAASLSLYEASLLPWFERHVLGGDAEFAAGAVYVILTPDPAAAPHSSLVHMFQTIRRQYDTPRSLYAGTALPGQDGWGLEFPLLDATLRGTMKDNRPIVLLGTAFSFVQWLDFLAAKKSRYNLPAGSRIMETGGYKGRSRVVAKSELRRLFSRYFGVPNSLIVTEYGMSELSSQAYDHVAGQKRNGDGIFRFPPWTQVQIISPETGAPVAAGETGLLRIFDLANIHSVMALQTEDLAVNRESGFELLGRAASAEPRGCSLMAAS